MQPVQSIFDYYGILPLFKNVNWINHDLTLEVPEKELTGPDTCVFHCAAKVSFRKSMNREMYLTNVIGTANLVNASIAGQAGRFVHVGSIAGLGEGIQPVNEDCHRAFKGRHSGYSGTKYLGELEVWRGVAEGLNAIIINPSVIIGPWTPGSGIGPLFKATDSGLRFYPMGSTGFADVRDVTEAMIRMAGSEITGHRYIANGVNLSFRELLSMIAKLRNQPEPGIPAGRMLTVTASVMLEIVYALKGKKNTFTPETARISSKKSSYSNNKISETFSVKFHRIEDTLIHYHEYYEKQSYKDSVLRPGNHNHSRFNGLRTP